jgi:hypothetical protein
MTDELHERLPAMSPNQMMEHQIMNEITTNTTIDTAADTTAADVARRAKVADLQRRRASSGGQTSDVRSPAATPTSTRSRNGVAQGSKIAATAMGMTAMLAIVGGMSIAAQRKTNAAPTPTTAPVQVVVVIHPAVSGVAGTAGASTGVQTPGKAIALSAQPVARQATPSAAPVAKTSGSH